MRPWLLGIAGMIYKTINEYGVDAASKTANEISCRMIYAAYMILEGSERDVTSLI